MTVQSPIVAITLGILLLTGILVAMPAASLADGFLQDKDGFDREYCEAECRRAYGGYEWAPPHLGSSGQLGYNTCILKCNRQFWKSFDKEMGKLDK